MAPWPEPHSEPKAPDKTCEETCENPSERHKGDTSEDKDPASTQWKTASSVVDKNPSELSGLDDRQLKALLDEAITYKCPKDREGKSNLFRELLQEVEADESECRGVGAKRGNGTAGRCRRPGNRRADVSERNTRGGSLQNLVYAINSDLESHSGAGFNRRRGQRKGVQQVNVSARQREGGSLPCNVNVDTSASGALFLEQRAGGSRRQHSTVDDISAGVYGYKANSRSKRKDYGPSTTTVDDINTGVTSYRNSNCGSKKRNEHDDVKKRHPDLQRGTVDDLVTASSRSAKRKDLKQLGHSSDDIYAGGPVDFPPKFVVDVRNEGGAGANGFFTMAGKFTAEKMASRMRAPSEAAIYRPAVAAVRGPGGPVGHFLPSGDDDLDGTELVPLNQLYARSVPSAVESVAVAAAAAAAAAVAAPSSTATSTMSSSAPSASGTTRKEMTVNGVADPVDLENVGALILSSEDPFRTHDTATIRTEANGRAKDISVALYHDRIPHTVMSTYIVNADCGDGDPRDKISRQRDLFNGVTRGRNDLSVYQLGDRNLHHFQSIFGSKDTILDKKLDENGNAVQQSSSSRKARKVKANNNENVYLAASLPGNRGDQEINVLVNYIESNSKRGHLTFQKDSKQRNSSSNGKRSEEKNRNDKRKGKLKKCNSLEEISRTKFSDLTAHDSKGVDRRPKKQVTLDNAELDQGHKDQGGGDRRSWGPEGSASSSSREDSSEEVAKNRKFKKEGNVGRTRTLSDWEGVTVVDSNLLATDVSSADFHLVTKKQRKKKTGRSSSIGRERNNNINNAYNNRDMAPRHGRSFCGQEVYQYRSDSPDHQHHRRKSTSSMPPSDKSADSSDLDSVHSLPISPSTPRPNVDKTSTSSGSTPQASYADIARMASSNVYPPHPQAHKWPSIGGPGTPASAPAKVPLWTANVTLHPASSVAATPPTPPTPVPSVSPPAPLPTVAASAPPLETQIPAAPSTAPPTGAPASAPSQDAAESAEPPSTKTVSTKRDAMTNTVSPDATPTESSVGNLLSDNAYPPLRDFGKSPVNQTVKSFIYQASKSTVGSETAATCRMANCVDVEHSVKRSASPAPPSTRKPVIILDEFETDAGAVGDPELTFGFEVNEQLLAGVCESSGEEEVSCPSPDMSRLSDKVPVEAADSSPSQTPSLRVTSTPSSVQTSSPPDSSVQTCTPSSTVSSSGVESGEASVKSVKEPVTVTSVELQQIVAFVGEAWDEVIKNLSSVRGAAGGPVKYYSEG